MRILISSHHFPTAKTTESFLEMLPLKKQLSASIITTASVEFKARNWHAKALKDHLEKLGIKTKFVDIEFDDIQELEASDVICLSGGNPYYLLNHLKASTVDQVLIRKAEENCLIYGISAGFLVLQKDINIIDHITPDLNKIELEDKIGLHLIDEIILPHYDRFVASGKIEEEKIKHYEKENKCNIQGLGEKECIRYFDGNRELF